MDDMVSEIQNCKTESCVQKVQDKYEKVDKQQSAELEAACSANPASTACQSHLAKARDGDMYLYTQADLAKLGMDFGQYGVGDVCKAAPANCIAVLSAQDKSNAVDADRNMNNPELVKAAADRNRAVFKSLGFDMDGMSDQEVNNTMSSMAMGAVGIIGSKAKGGSGKGSALPTPIPTTASNGLSYKSNPKHTPG